MYVKLEHQSILKLTLQKIYIHELGYQKIMQTNFCTYELVGYLKIIVERGP